MCYTVAMKIRKLILYCAVVLTSACTPIQSQPMNAPQPSDDTQPITQTSGAPAVVDLSEVTPAPAEEDAQEVKPAPGVPDPNTQLTQQVMANLSEQKGIDISQIEVVSVEAVTWPDGSLGCPEPGMMYTQVLIEGAKIVLQAGDQQFEYHTGGDHFVLCEP